MCCVVCRTGTTSIKDYIVLRFTTLDDDPTIQHDDHLHMHLRSVLFIYLHDGNCISMILILQAHDPATLFCNVYHMYRIMICACHSATTSQPQVMPYRT